MIQPDFIPPSSVRLTATTLTLDLGTHTGYAVGAQGAGATNLMQTTVRGTWEVMTEKEVRERLAVELRAVPHPHEIFPPKGDVSGSRKLVPAANH